MRRGGGEERGERGERGKEVRGGRGQGRRARRRLRLDDNVRTEGQYESVQEGDRERERERERETERGGRGCDVSDEQWGVLRGDVERLGQLSS